MLVSLLILIALRRVIYHWKHIDEQFPKYLSHSLPLAIEGVTNFIQLVSLQPVDQFLQTKLCCKAPNKSYLHIYRMYKSNNKQLKYQVISNCKIFIC